MAAELKIGIGAEIGGLMKGISDALSKVSGFQKEAQNTFNKLSTSEIQDTISKLNSKIKIIDGNVQIFGDSLANSKKALKFLNEAGLSAACRNLYGDDALLYLHFSLGDQKKGTYYDALKITEEYNNMYRKEPANV